MERSSFTEGNHFVLRFVKRVRLPVNLASQAAVKKR